jgi:GGDEF domain-containing protein
VDTDTPIAWLVPQRSTLDPVTGFVDRSWFDLALAQPQPPPASDGFGSGVIAVRLTDLAHLERDDGIAGRDGCLVLAAAIVHRFARTGDLAARLGPDRFALLTSRTPSDFTKTTSALRTRLQVAGIAAHVGWTSAGRDTVLNSSHERPDMPGAPDVVEAAAVRVRAVVRDATAASALLAEAAGILIQWHRCSPDQAQRELTHQAHELGMSVTATARLILGVASGRAMRIPAARGVDLHRAIRLANHTAPHQPSWTVEPPDAASTRIAMPHRPASRAALELHVAGRYQAAAGRSGSGGDWFDGFTLADGAIGVAVGDVAGHDTVAVTVMMQLRSLLRAAAASSQIAPSQVLRRLDRGLVELGCERLATVVFGWIRIDATGRPVLSWSNAGHPAPAVVTEDGAARLLACTNDLLLGLGTDHERSDLTLALPTGATVLLYSDGLVETRTIDIDVGLARLCAALHPLATRPVRELRDLLLPAMVAPNAPDDVTILAVRVRDSASIPEQPRSARECTDAPPRRA